MTRALIYTILSIALLVVYGTEVCPFLESLSMWQLARNIGLTLLAVVALRPLIVRNWVAPLPPNARVNRQVRLDFAGFAAAGVALTILHRVAYGFPTESGLKLLVGCLLLGMFYALDLGLQTERDLVQEAAAAGKRLAEQFELRSLTRSFATVAVIVLGLLGAVFFLVVNKDISWLVTIPPEGIRSAQRSVLVEVVFVVIVMMTLAINLAVSYSRNLKVFFDLQTDVLTKVARGHLDTYVPVAGSNEFALIARHTNEMIDDLREKRRIETLFGKVVSPEIARRLLAPGADGLNLAGTSRNLVILFSDIRNFTRFAETQRPEAVVSLLNSYFAVMVKIVREHGGLVDKFIGDGMLAVFGLETGADASSNAVAASVKMLDGARELTRELKAPVEIGVGIHRGDVVAGSVGAPERLEFTFIGDAVNTAARLEGVTKELNAPVIISRAIREELTGAMELLPWIELGEHQLKGKSNALTLYGLKAELNAI